MKDHLTPTRRRKLWKRGTFKALLVFLALQLIPLAYPTVSAPASPDQLYKQARSRYRLLTSRPLRHPNRQEWTNAVAKFQQVQRADSRKLYGDKCAYLIARLYHYMFHYFRQDKDAQAAIAAYKTVIDHFPRSPLADDAQFLLGIFYLDELHDPSHARFELLRVSVLFPEGDMQARAVAKVEQLDKEYPHCAPGGEQTAGSSVPSAGAVGGRTTGHAWKASTIAQLQNIKYWSAEDYTRVVVYLSGPVDYQAHTLPADEPHHKPPKIYVDFQDCELKADLPSTIPIMDGFLQRVRVGQHSSLQVRLVLDIQSIETHKVFTLVEPFRLVIDVRGKKSAPIQAATTKPRGKNKGTPSLAQQLGLGVKRIVLDPGHGGKDAGAISANGVYEKDVVLRLAKKLKKVLVEQTGCEVILTRTNDRFLALEERTAIANARKADLFISIHTNAHEDRKLAGVETYFLSLSKNKRSIQLAAMENATSTKSISDLEGLLRGLMLCSKVDESTRLAREVQKKIVNHLRARYKTIRDLGVKQAPFYVLLGAEMPSILVETAFLTNPAEERRLQDQRFQEVFARGVAAGVNRYIEQMKKYAQR